MIQCTYLIQLYSDNVNQCLRAMLTDCLSRGSYITNYSLEIDVIIRNLDCKRSYDAHYAHIVRVIGKSLFSRFVPGYSNAINKDYVIAVVKR